ncbi:beta-lactamase/transpeptidase-like protein [Aaosphaeria arxii CBS 175.79]|uniref:Beta-lactamase/transpeptidase-like protein n=1 Tax=Aaosphaeria arxii CBS 175.79 TaxID=1450172 RepID=A0A6A5XPI6_9PLEO|nr:beta-lactamase/transpeptidase-like protein [Aaosphaeria arxii CBS 175.79]KAF2015175.1 beta-lactamase/transpeptidase-like protein [Aaosphaeria arxii CBS 175.79]
MFSGLLAFAQLPVGNSAPNCPLIGPEYPPPRHLATHPIWKRAIDNITNIFNYLDSAPVSGVDDFSYSFQIFSTNPGRPILWERYRTAPDLPDDTVGVKKVDGKTVYRLGSVSKLITVLAFLAEVGDYYWNMPITEFIPELKKYANRPTSHSFDSVRETAWEDVTIGALASQVSGLGRDYGILGELTQTEDAPQPWEVGFNSLPLQAAPPCGAWPLCTREEFFKGLDVMYPSYPPWQTATYSDVAYQLLAYALESISGKSFKDILEERIIKPLGLNHTYYEFAPPSEGIIPDSLQSSYWSVSLGDASPGGNMYASAYDLSTIGRAILSSTLIKPSMTRRWLNPVTFSADFLASIGAPWGIRRIQLAKETQPYRTLSVFTKAGTFRKYTSFITLLRDFNIGFTIMMSGTSTLTNFQVADILGESLIPAYDAVARAEAEKLYSGIYVSKNSYLVISTDPVKPGLGVGTWFSNGTNMVETAIMLQSGSLPSLFGTEARPEARLYYTQLETKNSDGSKRQSWKAVFEDTGGPSPSASLWSTGCGSWVGITGVTYGSLPLDEFVFNIDSSGKVTSVENLALRSKLYKL